MKYHLVALTHLVSLGVAAQSQIQKSMLDTFVKYASIDSKSDYDSICTQGQHNMPLALKADVEEAVVKSKASGVKVKLSDANYLYVTIPANVRTACSTMGISCHLDVTPEAPGGNIVPIVDTRDGLTIVRTDGTTLLGADDKCGCTIAMQLIRTILSDKSIKHGTLQFAFCPNEDVGRKFPNVKVDVVYDEIQYENVAYTLHPQAQRLVETAAAKIGKDITFAGERGGTTASMFAAKGLNGGMCVFTSQHDIHSTREYADLQEMEEAYRLMLEIIKQVITLK